MPQHSRPPYGHRTGKIGYGGNALSAVSLRRESGLAADFPLKSGAPSPRTGNAVHHPFQQSAFQSEGHGLRQSALIPSFSCRKRKMDGAIRMRTPVKERLLGTTHRVYGAAFCLSITVTALPDHPASALQLCQLGWDIGKIAGSCFPFQKGG